VEILNKIYKNVDNDDFFVYNRKVHYPVKVCLQDTLHLIFQKDGKKTMKPNIKVGSFYLQLL